MTTKTQRYSNAHSLLKRLSREGFSGEQAETLVFAAIEGECAARDIVAGSMWRDYTVEYARHAPFPFTLTIETRKA